jgi:c-di-GMP-binding flagellar brake protein YcgR
LYIDEIAIGTDIEFEIRCGGRFMSFHSTTMLIIGDSILATPIVVNDRTVGFNDDCRINIVVKFEDKVYQWVDVIVKLVKYNGVIYHKIDLEGDGKPYNRRESFRLYIGEDMPIYINDSSGSIALTVLIKDISETGVGFITKEELDINRTIRLKLKDFNTFINLSGVIVRKEFLEHLDSFIYGCKFNEKNNRLGKYLARKQGEFLRKKSNPFFAQSSTVIDLKDI